MKEKVFSQTTGKSYSPVDVVRIINVKQAAAYINHGAELLDIYGSRDFKTGEPMLVYIFNRSETTALYDLWCKHELK
jgi:hypothetical protein